MQGKRHRYSNPFRFYLTVSILFFLILGMSKNIDKFKELQNGTVQKESNIISFENDAPKKNVDIDSLKNAVNKELKSVWIPLDSAKRKKIVNQVARNAQDSTKTISKNQIDFEGLEINKYLKFQKKYPKLNIDESLDSLQKEKTFFNRFIYSRAKVINSLITEGKSQEQFKNKLLSSSSIALFVFLPLFTLFLKLLPHTRTWGPSRHLTRGRVESGRRLGICVSKFVPLTLPEEALIKVLAPPNSEYPRRKPPVRVHTKPYARARLATCSG